MSTDAKTRCSFVADPAVVYFPVSSLGCALRQSIKVVNSGKLSARMHVLPCRSPVFRWSMDSKKGFIAPGMYQSLEIMCIPKNLDVLEETVYVHGEVVGLPGDSRQLLKVPVYCFPATTSLKFPKFINFGNVHVGTRIQRTIPLAVDIAIAFQFQLHLSNLESDFRVTPCSGIIPANGKVNVVVSFCPKSLITHRTELILEVSQFNMTPVSCLLLGVARPGSIRDDTIKAYLGKLPATMEELDGKHHLDRARRQILKTSARGGAGHGDAHTEAKWQQRRQLKSLAGSKNQQKKHQNAKDEASMPERLNHSAVARIMGRPDAEAQDARARAHMSGHQDLAQDEVSEQLSPLENLALDADTKMAIFMEQLQKAREHEKRVKSSFQLHLGTDPPSQAEQERVAALRAEHAARMRAREDDAAACRSEPELQVTGARCTCSAGAVGAQADPPPANPDASGQGTLESDPENRDKEHRQSGPSDYVLDLLRAGELHDDLAKRAFSRKRFVEAGRLVVIRNRAGKRLRKIQALLKQLDWDKDRVQEEVAMPHLLAPDEIGDRPGVHPAEVRDLTDMTTSLPPQFSEVNFFNMDPVEVAPYGGFSELALAELEVPFEYIMLGYESENHFVWEDYIPEMHDMELETGAVEEDVDALPFAASAAYIPQGFSALHAELPAAALRSAANVESIGGKWLRTQTGVFTAELPVWGMGPDYLPQPVELAQRRCAEREALESNALRTTTGLPLLSDAWRPRHGNRLLDRSSGEDGGSPVEVMQDPRESTEHKPDHGIQSKVRLPTREAVGEWLPPAVPNCLLDPADLPRSLAGEPRAQTAEGFNRHRQEARDCANTQMQQKFADQISAFDSQAQTLNSMVKSPSRHHI